VTDLRVILSPRAVRDLDDIHPRDDQRIRIDLELLAKLPWPAGKTKPLKGHPLWEMKCGDFRALYRREGETVRVFRVVNRRDLDRALGR
jgi:mRNA-degrading endonuclease RelE of RelBE toxin-antitoxin system